ncbi:glycosyltransferase family 25 protein [Burkholderia stagnalis]|uniref:glycosyltransferase family 25 protein n=1 Tax=Burkholderia stagnalis TaxID=1503054 RepID=UPI000756EF30|nr:glycosyltransferase family 25 protein [Burkholderia stagnalis]KVC52286.1 glycosyl transferase family 25 [Burkholderia stagnalis]KVN17466.1 glycosyl transferase family 25 [Burkholderia stagnalis]KWI73574.1 glycosyl transferase family 25 [Burkholderia stagnalis]KWK63370.1 glycosyl transferase family 25 [Burkholderia stagnalis]KWN17556.1 glycosyl transferase family 25 [Burkholderia stagnalis]
MKRGISYVCISLARAQDRRAKMAEQFAAHDIDARFFDAFELKGSVDTIPGYDAAGRQRRYGWPLSRGEVGCYLSHRAAWLQLVQSSNDTMCVMEDDITLLDGFKPATLELHDTRPHWDMVRLMGITKRPQVEYATLPSGMRIMWMDSHPTGTQCYMITRQAAARMLAYTANIVHAIDIAFDRSWEHGQRLYITSPEYVADPGMPTMITDRSDSRTFGQRLKAKYHRKIERISSRRFNDEHRPKRPITIESAPAAAEATPTLA